MKSFPKAESSWASEKMSKFTVRLKIQGFELEVDGDRQSVPEITGALRQQMGNLLSVPHTLVDGQAEQAPEKNITPPDVYTEPTKQRSRKVRRPKAGTVDVSPLEFRHDVEKWGAPLQNWTTAQKAVWLLYVIENQGLGSELSAAQIEATFNKHFRRAKSIYRRYVVRDLSREKGKSVGEETTKTPPTWYLTQVGKEYAQKLVTEAKSEAGHTV